MKIWFDTEFIEDGRTIDLISIGMVREDSSILYAENAECDLSRASPWVTANVVPHLTGQRLSRAEIAQRVKDFAGESPEFWSYFADYDWVALCQLYGTMMDLPSGWPMFCLDVKQWAVMLGDPMLPAQTSTEHHALADAQWTREAWEFLRATTEPADAPSQEQPGFTFAECPECGFSSVTRDGTIQDWGCPLCAGDSGHDVGMFRRVARSTDRPEGCDARKEGSADG